MTRLATKVSEDGLAYLIVILIVDFVQMIRTKYTKSFPQAEL